MRVYAMNLCSQQHKSRQHVRDLTIDGWEYIRILLIISNSLGGLFVGAENRSKEPQPAWKAGHKILNTLQFQQETRLLFHRLHQLNLGGQFLAINVRLFFSWEGRQCLPVVSFGCVVLICRSA